MCFYLAMQPHQVHSRQERTSMWTDLNETGTSAYDYMYLIIERLPQCLALAYSPL